ncbi:G2/M phase-specific E3 ubiquitin-protein ligase-like [Haliotis rufescens]|uniref:G2/M phase-specific E3 ubiquitin-protein ligase-like n=1 Tax=Haliotis rufescens TaxID=6454 RepID=UPI001EB02C69|nr:G2/M phase-specific E3 ubiquitin-protein ligase-like [Haliotis rufescens]XP_046368574.2 G2/M phase-specific E3 ubiquitin-protein ligase-like [Haliotis rufescens]
MEDLERFLTDRGVPSENVQLLVADKIDPSLILEMKDEELSRYIPTYGDRLATVVWCKSRQLENPEKQTKSSGLFDRIREKMSNRRKRGQKDFDFLQGNKNARKTSRRIEVGWMDFDTKVNAFKQVRSQNGGGTRHLSVYRDAGQADILAVAKQLFFTDGESKRGNEAQFTFSIKDFKGEEMGQKTVANVYEETKVKIIRFYMYTKKKENEQDLSTDVVQHQSNNESASQKKIDDGTPIASTGTPTASPGTPTISTGMPTASTRTPTASTGTFTASTGTSTASTGTSTASTGTSTASTGTSTASTGTTTASTGTPTVVFNSGSAMQSISTDDSLPDLDTVSSEGGEAELGVEDQNGETVDSTVTYNDVDSSEGSDLAVFDIPRQSNRNLVYTRSDQPLPLQPPPLRLEAVRHSENLHEILTRLASVINKERRNIVNVTRRNVMSGGIRAFNRPSFNPENGLSVKFAGEYAIDDGGPSREFLRLLMKEISSLPIFTGDETKKMLDLNYTALQSGLYLTAGKMIAYSVVHNGPLPRFFSPLLFSTLVGDSQIQPKIDDIQDVAQRESLLKIRNAEDMSSFLDAVGGADQLIQLAGCYSLTLSLAKKEELCDALIHFIVLGRIKECLDQFQKGLATLGVLAEMRVHIKEVRELFCFDEKYELNASVLEMVFSEPSFSEPGSNRRRMEEETVSYWMDYLLDVAEGTESVTLSDILVFATGAGSIPPLGLHPQPQLTFHTAIELNPENRENFPRANTCANVLDIPMISNYNLFKKNMNAAISVNIFTSE